MLVVTNGYRWSYYSNESDYGGRLIDPRVAIFRPIRSRGAGMIVVGWSGQYAVRRGRGAHNPLRKNRGVKSAMSLKDIQNRGLVV